MAEKIRVVQGNTLPYIQVNLTHADGSAMDVQGAAVNLYFRQFGTTDLLSTIPCTPVNDGTDGKVMFNFPDSTLSVPAGIYEGEIQVDFGEGMVQTVYETIRFQVRAKFN